MKLIFEEKKSLFCLERKVFKKKSPMQIITDLLKLVYVHFGLFSSKNLRWSQFLTKVQT